MNQPAEQGETLSIQFRNFGGCILDYANWDVNKTCHSNKSWHPKSFLQTVASFWIQSKVNSARNGLRRDIWSKSINIRLTFASSVHNMCSDCFKFYKPPRYHNHFKNGRPVSCFMWDDTTCPMRKWRNNGGDATRYIQNNICYALCSEMDDDAFFCMRRTCHRWFVRGECF